MVERLDVSPTQGNLLLLRDKLKQLRSGHDLLDRKREALIQALLEALDKAEAVEQAAQKRFRAAYEALQRARLRMGVDLLRPVSRVPTVAIDVQIDRHSIMGVKVPAVQTRIRSLPLPYGLGDTSAALDQARSRWLEVVRLLGELTEAIGTVWRLASEVRKTQRQVNALESTIIPQYEHTVSYIEQRLAETEREDIVHAKKVKGLREESRHS